MHHPIVPALCWPVIEKLNSTTVHQLHADVFNVDLEIGNDVRSRSPGLRVISKAVTSAVASLVIDSQEKRSGYNGRNDWGIRV